MGRARATTQSYIGPDASPTCKRSREHGSFTQTTPEQSDRRTFDRARRVGCGADPVSDHTVVRADRWVDIDAGEVRSPAVIVIQGNRIVAVNPKDVPSVATEIDLGDVTLLPGLMDMELNLLISGPENPDGLPNPMHGVVDDPVYRTLARDGERSRDPHGRLHHGAKSRAHGQDGRLRPRCFAVRGPSKMAGWSGHGSGRLVAR